MLRSVAYSRIFIDMVFCSSSSYKSFVNTDEGVAVNHTYNVLAGDCYMGNVPQVEILFASITKIIQ